MYRDPALDSAPTLQDFVAKSGKKGSGGSGNSVAGVMDNTDPFPHPCKACPLMQDAIADPDLALKSSCARCGARMRPQRLSLAYMAHLLREDVFGSERGLLLTVWHLFIRPQRVASAFISGDSLRYYGPIKYFVVMFALSLLASRGTPALDGLIVKVLADAGIAGRARVQDFVAGWNAALYLPLVVLLALATRGFFRQRGLNYAEHLVIATYGWAHLVLLSSVTSTLLVLVKQLHLVGGWVVLLALVPPVYWFWYCSAVFSQRNVAGWVRAFVTVPFAVICYLLLLVLAVPVIKALGPLLPMAP